MKGECCLATCIERLSGTRLQIEGIFKISNGQARREGKIMDTQRTVRPSLQLGLGLCVLLTALGAQLRGAAHQNQTAEIVVDEIRETRPVAAAVHELEKRYGWVITHEEPTIEFTADLIDITPTRP